VAIRRSRPHRPYGFAYGLKLRPWRTERPAPTASALRLRLRPQAATVADGAASPDRIRLAASRRRRQAATVAVERHGGIEQERRRPPSALAPAPAVVRTVHGAAGKTRRRACSPHAVARRACAPPFRCHCPQQTRAASHAAQVRAALQAVGARPSHCRGRARPRRVAPPRARRSASPRAAGRVLACESFSFHAPCPLACGSIRVGDGGEQWRQRGKQTTAAAKTSNGGSRPPGLRTG
jgi:hypothetical protein